MTFPIINHIDDILPHIAGRSEFVVAQRDGYQVIDYNYALADSFDDPMRLECRGIKFAPDGKILARPLHKFFNIGERPNTQPHGLDFSRPHAVTEKLDGSMIHPAIVNGEVVFMTRMGRTDVARKAERHLLRDDHPGGTDFFRQSIRVCLLRGFTPIFEFTAPDNRIVVRYPESQLSLLAIRETVSGRYWQQNALASAATEWRVPLVAHHQSDWNSGPAFLHYARAVTGREGFVVRFGNGLWVKAKGEDYVLKHKAKDSILQEKNVLALILRDEIDDVLPLLEIEDRANVERYRDAVDRGVRSVADAVSNHVLRGEHLDQKAFAVEHQPKIDGRLRSVAFMVRSGRPADEAVREIILKAVGSQSSVDATRHLHGARFEAANDNTIAESAAA